MTSSQRAIRASEEPKTPQLAVYPVPGQTFVREIAEEASTQAPLVNLWQLHYFGGSYSLGFNLCD